MLCKIDLNGHRRSFRLADSAGSSMRRLSCVDRPLDCLPCSRRSGDSNSAWRCDSFRRQRSARQAASRSTAPQLLAGLFILARDRPRHRVAAPAAVAEVATERPLTRHDLPWLTGESCSARARSAIVMTGWPAPRHRPLRFFSTSRACSPRSACSCSARTSTDASALGMLAIVAGGARFRGRRCRGVHSGRSL